MSKEKFKVGDKVRVIKVPNGALGAKNRIGFITDEKARNGRTPSDYSNNFVKVNIDDEIWALGTEDEIQLELIESSTVVYEVTYPTIPDYVNKVKSYNNVFIRSGNSWIDITNNNEGMSQRYMLFTYGPLTPVKEEPKKYNLTRRINGESKDLILFERPLERAKDYLEERLKARCMRAVSIDYVEGDHLHIVEENSESTHWDIEEA